MRTVVIGGYGNFDARICRALATHPDIQVVAVGRNPDPAQLGPRVEIATLNLHSPYVAPDLKELSPQIVIHCAGPFQRQDYRVAMAAISAGAHYIDLAGGREFVAGFADEFDSCARKAELLMISGASTVPALSSAVIDDLSGRFRQIEEIRIAIASGQRAPRGMATMAAVSSFAGRSFRWMRDGAWREAWGCQELARMRFADLGVRWAAACDIPDLELFPRRYPGVRTVEFHAALELGIQHFVLWAASALRRAGVPLPIEQAAKPLGRLASLLDWFGGKRGGMLVSLTGIRTNGERGRVEWHLTAEAENGPEIPCVPAILLARKLARGEIAARGAFPCVGFLKLADFGPLFVRWGISTTVEESAA